MSIELAHTVHGDGPPLIVLHGLFGSARNWTTVAKQLAQTHRVYALDLRNHGSSPWSDSMSYHDLADDVQRFIARLGAGPVAVLGHSMGGKTAMMLALAHPSWVKRLIAVDIAPVAYEGGELKFYISAMQNVRLDGLARRSEADEQLRDQVPDPGIRAFLMQNLTDRDGRFAWRLNLPALARTMPQISGFPEVTTQYPGPSLFVSGQRSDYVRPAHHEAIRQLFPSARFAVIAGAGHWVHAEQPQLLVQHVLAFLQDEQAGTPTS